MVAARRGIAMEANHQSSGLLSSMGRSLSLKGWRRAPRFEWSDFLRVDRCPRTMSRTAIVIVVVVEVAMICTDYKPQVRS